MATKKYRTNVDAFAIMRNREAVENGLMEGRIIPPVTRDLPRGSLVDLDPEDEHTRTLLELGSIEDPHAAVERQQAELEARQAQLDAERQRLDAEHERARRDHAPVEDLKGDELDHALAERGLSTEGKVEEKRERLREHRAAAA